MKRLLIMARPGDLSSLSKDSYLEAMIPQISVEKHSLLLGRQPQSSITIFWHPLSKHLGLPQGSMGSPWRVVPKRFHPKHDYMHTRLHSYHFTL